MLVSPHKEGGFVISVIKIQLEILICILTCVTLLRELRLIWDCLKLFILIHLTMEGNLSLMNVWRICEILKVYI